MSPLDADIAHLLAGSMVLVSFLLLYQDRMFALLNVFALHAFVLSFSVAWQAYLQDAPHLFITAAIAHLAHSTPTRYLFSSTDFNSYVTVTFADGAPRRQNGRLAASSAPGLGVSPNVSLLGAPAIEVD